MALCPCTNCCFYCILCVIAMCWKKLTVLWSVEHARAGARVCLFPYSFVPINCANILSFSSFFSLFHLAVCRKAARLKREREHHEFSLKMAGMLKPRSSDSAKCTLTDELYVFFSAWVRFWIDFYLSVAPSWLVSLGRRLQRASGSWMAKLIEHSWMRNAWRRWQVWKWGMWHLLGLLFKELLTLWSKEKGDLPERPASMDGSAWVVFYLRWL